VLSKASSNIAWNGNLHRWVWPAPLLQAACKKHAGSMQGQKSCEIGELDAARPVMKSWMQTDFQYEVLSLAS